jgi:hypothetical protein
LRHAQSLFPLHFQSHGVQCWLPECPQCPHKNWYLVLVHLTIPLQGAALQAANTLAWCKPRRTSRPRRRSASLPDAGRSLAGCNLGPLADILKKGIFAVNFRHAGSTSQNSLHVRLSRAGFFCHQVGQIGDNDLKGHALLQIMETFACLQSKPAKACLSKIWGLLVIGLIQSGYWLPLAGII